jgi:hypothetical protein
MADALCEERRLGSSDLGVGRVRLRELALEAIATRCTMLAADDSSKETTYPKKMHISKSLLAIQRYAKSVS